MLVSGTQRALLYPAETEAAAPDVPEGAITENDGGPMITVGDDGVVITEN